VKPRRRERRTGESIDQLLRRADTALYEAKSSGLDRCRSRGCLGQAAKGECRFGVRPAHEMAPKPQAGLAQRPLERAAGAERKKFPGWQRIPFGCGLASFSDRRSRRSAPIVSRCCRRADCRRGSSRTLTVPRCVQDSVPGLVVLRSFARPIGCGRGSSTVEAGKYNAAKSCTSAAADETTLKKITRNRAKSKGLKNVPR